MEKVAVVTGTAKPNGIGAACAYRLAADGFAIVAVDVGTAGAFGPLESPAGAVGLRDLVASLRAQGADASEVLGSVGEQHDVDAIFAYVKDRHGRIDVLVNNAAAPHGNEGVELDQLEIAEWDRIMAINSRGTFMMCRAALAMMRNQQRGRIVNIASVAGRVGMPRSAAYGASKASVIGLTRSLAVDGASIGVTVNAVCPGYIDTNRAASDARRHSGDPTPRADASPIPAGRLGEPAEVAAAVAFFASDEASYITAQVLTVDGGLFPS